jgi:hypothetical protein
MLGEFVSVQSGVSSLITFSSKILAPSITLTATRHSSSLLSAAPLRICLFALVAASAGGRESDRPFRVIAVISCSSQKSRSSSKLCKYFYGQSLGATDPTHRSPEGKNTPKIWSHHNNNEAPDVCDKLRYKVGGERKVFSSLIDTRYGGTGENCVENL